MLKKLIKFVLFLMILIGLTNAQSFKLGEVRGLFMDLGVAPKIPLGEFAETHNLGVGVSVTFSYTDNFKLPIFFYTKFEYNHFPGNQNYYKGSAHSGISSNMLSVNPGIRFYLKPLLENVVILMPVIEAGGTFIYTTTANQFKIDSGKANFTDESTKYGLHIGAGVSMFLLDVMGYYTFLNDNQYMSFDLKIRIPIYLTM